MRFRFGISRLKNRPTAWAIRLSRGTCYLAGWRSAQLSHEQVTDRITRDLSTLEGITGVTVHTMWETAGMQVSGTSGRASCDLLREPDRSQNREASHA